MRMIVVALLAFQSFGAETPQSPTAAEIMQRVAQNQDREQKARTEFVYEEDVHSVMRRKDGKLLREEYRRFAVTPGAKGTEKKRISVKGRYWNKGAYVPFEGDPVPQEGLSGVFDDDPHGSKSRDGVDKDLFPLTTDQQKQDTFEKVGERIVQGRPAYEIHFQPTKSNDYGWKGEALIDKEEFQPVSIYTQLSRKLPLAVRTMLGTDVPGLGFSIQYKRVDKDLWFPSTFGTEFSLHALFFLNRTFTESVENKDFRRAAVDSRVAFAEPEK